MGAFTHGDHYSMRSVWCHMTPHHGIGNGGRLQPPRLKNGDSHRGLKIGNTNTVSVNTMSVIKLTMLEFSI